MGKAGGNGDRASWKNECLIKGMGIYSWYSNMDPRSFKWGNTVPKRDEVVHGSAIGYKSCPFKVGMNPRSAKGLK